MWLESLKTVRKPYPAMCNTLVDFMSVFSNQFVYASEICPPYPVYFVPTMAFSMRPLNM